MNQREQMLKVLDTECALLVMGWHLGAYDYYYNSDNVPQIVQARWKPTLAISQCFEVENKVLLDGLDKTYMRNLINKISPKADYKHVRVWRLMHTLPLVRVETILEIYRTWRIVPEV